MTGPRRNTSPSSSTASPAYRCCLSARSSILLSAQKQPPEYLENLVRLPLTLVYSLAGEFERARDEGERVQQIEIRTFASCRWEDAASVGFALLRRGEIEAARHSLDRTLARMTERNQIAAISGCSFVLGLLATEEGRLNDAAALLRRSLDIARHGGSVLFELWVLPALCEVLIEMGDREGARTCLERGFSLLETGRNWYGLPAPMHRARALLAREEHAWDEAETDLGQAVTLDRRFALPWDEAKTFYEWARLHRRRDRPGDREQAASKRAAARQVFERIGAAREVEKTFIADL
jgi:ATP/maltotriose-dependent transcriptional regulator MalT